MTRWRQRDPEQWLNPQIASHSWRHKWCKCATWTSDSGKSWPPRNKARASSPTGGDNHNQDCPGPILGAPTPRVYRTPSAGTHGELERWPPTADDWGQTDPRQNSTTLWRQAWWHQAIPRGLHHVLWKFPTVLPKCPSLMIPFLTSHLEGDTEDWWVHLRDDYWYIPPEPKFDATVAEINDYDAGPRYRYPSWEDFIDIFCEQFRDPAIELVHEKRMGELRMNNNPTHIYFRKLKREAKLANQLDDESDRGTLVRAVCKGIPSGYAHIIANIGIGVPRTYLEWKHHILQMYDKHRSNGFSTRPKESSNTPTSDCPQGTKKPLLWNTRLVHSGYMYSRCVCVFVLTIYSSRTSDTWILLY